MNRRGRYRASGRGFTLIEVLVAMSILCSIAMLIYSAFSGMKRSKEGIERVNDRYREGRLAMARMVRELQSAFISAHEPIAPVSAVQKTVFRGTRGSPGDRIDFVSFSHRRLLEDSKDTDQAELSYFTGEDLEHSGRVNLLRRVSPRIDLVPDKGGKVEVLATDIDLFKVEFLDPQTGQWQERWDTTQATEQAGRLPLQVRLTLVLNGGARHSADHAMGTIRLVTKVTLPITKALTFATQGT
jgi:general secretion pathway protein J